VDDATLFGVPALKNGVSPSVLRGPDAVIVDPGGTDGKLETPILKADHMAVWRATPYRANARTSRG